MTVREALVAIAQRALAKRDAEALQAAQPDDRINEFDDDGAQLCVRRKGKGLRVLK